MSVMSVIQQIIHVEGSEDDYRVSVNIEVQITPPDYNSKESDIDYLGCTELVDYRIYSIEKRIQTENSPLAPVTFRSAKDWLTYNWIRTELSSLPKDDQDYITHLVKREVQNSVNC